MKDHIFISHSSLDDVFVKELRIALEGSQLPVWVDSRHMGGGDKLAKGIETAIEQARQVIVVLSPNTIKSSWVRREVEKALAVEKVRKDDSYKVVPLLLGDVQPSAFQTWFGEEPVGVPVELKTAGVSKALPAILAALGERLPTDYQPAPIVVAKPVEELILKLSDLKIETIDGKRRASAMALLLYEPANPASREVESERFTFTAPLGPIEADELNWYLEKYFIWPVGLFKERAERIEQKLPEWGEDLYKAALDSQSVREPLAAWQNASDGAARCFSLIVDGDLPEGAGAEEQKVANEAASELLSLPWEMLNDGRGYLFQGRRSTLVRRRLPIRRLQEVIPTQLPIRILLVSPRPEDEVSAYIDHRLSARPLMDAVESLGQLATLTVLAPPTFPALQAALRQADESGEGFDVVHFDGHGVFDTERALGALCFEDPNDAHKLEQRASQLIDAKKLAGMMRDYRIPLVFLEACQTARNEDDPTASVAAKLLDGGVASVIAMSHNVLVETAHRFVRAFYAALALGKQTGAAMLAGQQALFGDTYRGRVMGAGEFHLQDWFVPVLYQEAQDPQIITELLSKDVQRLEAKQRQLRLGALPEIPRQFQGRNRELLKLERLLSDDPYAVVRGQGGSGKTTLAAELARWLVRARRFRRAAFVSLERYSEARSVLDSLGRQLLPEGDNYSVAQFKDFKEALQPVERALEDFPTIIVLDNCESVLPGPALQQPTAAMPPSADDTLSELLDLCQTLLAADPNTRIVFTSREPLPAPFDHKRRDIWLGALDRNDAIALVGEVMRQEGLEPKADDPGGTPEEISELVDAANCHARALVVLAREVSKQGVRATTENLNRLMAELDREHPNDRENSLYASLELSLRRLPPEKREQAKVLAVFHGGAHLSVLASIFGTSNEDTETVTSLAASLVEVGVAENIGYGHLKIDPALPSFMRRQMTEPEFEVARAKWAEGMQQLTGILGQQLFQDARLALTLTLLELPNLLAMLRWAQESATPEEVIDLASRVEGLVANLGRKQALAQAVKTREQAAQKLGEWSPAGFTAETLNIDRLVAKRDLPTAHTVAERLLQRCLAAGEQAYRRAGYDIGEAYFKLGRVLRELGNAEPALQSLAEAWRRFQELADAGNPTAEVAASIAIKEGGDCLSQLGRLDEAAAAYEEAIRRHEKRGSTRELAVAKSNLATLRSRQGRYPEALQFYEEAGRIFASLGEPLSVATIWRQIGDAHTQSGQCEQAESAYQQSLAIEVREKHESGEALTLGSLGILYSVSGRSEDAARLLRQAADVYFRLQDLFREGANRNNLADTLFNLRRYDDARREVLRAIECKRPFGHAAQPWLTWNILFDLERVTGNLPAAIEARQRAIESFLAYRRAGGENQQPGATILCSRVAEAIQQKLTAQAEQLLEEFSRANPEAWVKAMVPKLRAIIQGDRNPALADDPTLDYGDAAELRLLLETLSPE